MNNFDKFINSLKAIGEFVSLSSPVVIAWFIYKQHRIGQKLDGTNDKVDAYHKEVNGKMGKLIETTEALGKAKGKEQEQKDQKKRDQNDAKK